MTWTGHSYAVGEILTHTTMNNMQADIEAAINGDSGAPHCAGALSSLSIGTMQTQSISAGGTWTIPAGTYIFNVYSPQGFQVALRISDGSTWYGSNASIGSVIISDGTNYEIKNYNGISATAYYWELGSAIGGLSWTNKSWSDGEILTAAHMDNFQDDIKAAMDGLSSGSITGALKLLTHENASTHVIAKQDSYTPARGVYQYVATNFTIQIQVNDGGGWDPSMALQIIGGGMLIFCDGENVRFYNDHPTTSQTLYLRKLT